MEEFKSLGAKRTEYQFAEPAPAVLEVFPNPLRMTGPWHAAIEIHSKETEFTSLCPITGQPDFASIEIRYHPNELCVESKSLKLYLFSYRNHQGFHEACVQMIADDLVKALDPTYLEVIGHFTPRGGISFEPKVIYMKPQTELKKKA